MPPIGCLAFPPPPSLKLVLAGCSVSTKWPWRCDRQRYRILGLCGPKGRSHHDILDSPVSIRLSLGREIRLFPGLSHCCFSLLHAAKSNFNQETWEGTQEKTLRRKGSWSTLPLKESGSLPRREFWRGDCGAQRQVGAAGSIVCVTEQSKKDLLLGVKLWGFIRGLFLPSCLLPNHRWTTPAMWQVPGEAPRTTILDLKLISSWWRQTTHTFIKNCHRMWRALWMPSVYRAGAVNLAWAEERDSKQALPGRCLCWVWKGDSL